MESGWRSDCLSGYVSALPWLSPSSNIRRILPIFQNQSFSRPTKSFNRVSNALFSIIRCNNFSRFSYYVHRPWNLSSFFALWNQSWSVDRKIFRWMIGVDRGRNRHLCSIWDVKRASSRTSRFILDPKITIQGRKKRRAWYRYVTIAGRIRDCDNIQIVDSSNVVAISFLQSIRLIVIPKRIVSWNATQR